MSYESRNSKMDSNHHTGRTISIYRFYPFLFNPDNNMCEERNMKATIFKCDKEGCKYNITRNKRNTPIDINPYPKEFKTVKHNKKPYHLCPQCYEEHQKRNTKFLDGSKNETNK